MKKTAIVAGAILFAIGWLTLAHEAGAKSDDVAQIKALEDSRTKAVNAGDLDGVMAVYAPDVFVYDVIPPRQYVGAKAYREDWAGFLKTPAKQEMSDLSVESDGKLAFSHMVWKASGTDANGAKFDLTLRVSDVYRKIKGKWLVVQEHISVPVDIATGKADLASKP